MWWGGEKKLQDGRVMELERGKARREDEFIRKGNDKRLDSVRL